MKICVNTFRATFYWLQKLKSRFIFKQIFSAIVVLLFINVMFCYWRKITKKFIEHEKLLWSFELYKSQGKIKKNCPKFRIFKWIQRKCGSHSFEPFLATLSCLPHPFFFFPKSDIKKSLKEICRFKKLMKLKSKFFFTAFHSTILWTVVLYPLKLSIFQQL